MTVPSDRLQLLMVSHYFESHRGGIEMVAGQLARSLAPDVTVTWAASDASPPPIDVAALALGGSNIIERRSGLPFPLPSLASVARLVRSVAASDAVLVHDGMYPTSIAAIVAARLLGRPAVLVQHIGRVPSPSLLQRILFATADRLLTRPMLRLASQVVFISATTQRHFARVRTRREPILVFNGVDAATFRPAASERERASERTSIGWPTDRPVALFVGRFLEKKGLLRLREMAAARPDIHWAFAGWGPCDAAEWNVPNVSVHRNRSGAELASLYRAADLLVLPSKSEGFPLVVQEALACGLLPVCCADAATADLAAQPYLVGVPESDDEKEVVSRYLEAIDATVAKRASGDERSTRATFARERYSWDSAARQYRALFRALCERPSARAWPEKAPA